MSLDVIKDHLYKVLKDCPRYFHSVLEEDVNDDARLEQSSFSPPPDQGLIFPTNPAGCAVTQIFKRLALFSSSLKDALPTFYSP